MKKFLQALFHYKTAASLKSDDSNIQYELGALLALVVSPHVYNCQYMRISANHNSLGCEQPSGLDVNQSLNAQDTLPGLISCAGVTGSVGTTYMSCTCNTDGWTGHTRLLHMY